MATEAIPRQDRLHILVEIEVLCAGYLRFTAVATHRPPSNAPAINKNRALANGSRLFMQAPPEAKVAASSSLNACNPVSAFAGDSRLPAAWLQSSFAP